MLSALKFVGNTADYLDRNVGESWVDKIRLSELDMRDANRCAAGQLTRRTRVRLDRSSGSWIRYGFAPSTPRAEYFAYEKLWLAWVLVICRRRLRYAWQRQAARLGLLSGLHKAA